MNKRYLKTKTIILAIIFAWIAVFTVDQISIYVRLPPFLRPVQLEALAHPLEPSFDASAAFVKGLPAGTSKDQILDTLDNAGFRTARDVQPSATLTNEVYHAIGYMPSGLIGKLIFISIEISIDMEFEQDKLKYLTASAINSGA